MADIRYRNSDNFILEVALDGTLVAGGGETVVTEAATFTPTVTEVTWRYDGVLTYTLVDETQGPLNDDGSAVNQGNGVMITDGDSVPSDLSSALTSSDSSITFGVVGAAGTNQTLNATVNEANVDHDALQNFVANEHIDHSSVSVVAGGDDALGSANNDLTANIGLFVDINGTTALGGAPAAGDELLIHNLVAGTRRKITVTELLSTVSATDRLAYNGGIRDIDASESLGARWGDGQARQGLTQIFAGNIVGMSITLRNPLTAGSGELRVTIDGVAQNGVGQTLTINSGQNASLDLTSAPIAFVADDILDLEFVTDGSWAPNNNHATVTLVVSL